MQLFWEFQAFVGVLSINKRQTQLFIKLQGDRRGLKEVIGLGVKKVSGRGVSQVGVA